MLTREQITTKIEQARAQRDSLRDQLNACMGFIQACEMILAEPDSVPSPPADAEQITGKEIVSDESH